MYDTVSLAFTSRFIDVSMNRLSPTVNVSFILWVAPEHFLVAFCKDEIVKVFSFVIPIRLIVK